MVEVLDLEDGLPELPEVELEDAGDGVDVGGVGGVCEGVVAALEAVAEVVDLDLGTIRSGHQVNFYTVWVFSSQSRISVKSVFLPAAQRHGHKEGGMLLFFIFLGHLGRLQF